MCAEANGSRVYVSCFVFFDRISLDIAAIRPGLCGAYATKCLCLASHVPIFNTMQKVLKKIHHACMVAGSTHPPQAVISHLLAAVPTPCSSCPMVG